MIKGDRPLAATPVIESPRLLTNRGQAEEAKQHATQCQSKTRVKARHGVRPKSVNPRSRRER